MDSGINYLGVVLKSRRFVVPLIGGGGLEYLSRKRSIDHGANFIEGTGTTSSENLHGNVAESCRLGWSSQNSPAGCIGGELVREAVFSAAADHSDLFDRTIH